MLDRVRKEAKLGFIDERGRRVRDAGVRRTSPRLESLERRDVPTASLAPLAAATVPQFLGLPVPLNGSGTTDAQTFSVTSSSPTITASVVQGEFLTLSVSHTASSTPGDISFAGQMTFQLFGTITPITVNRIEQLVTQGFYTGKNFHRVANNFPGPTDYIVQGGSVNGDGTGTINQPGFPFVDEYSPTLVNDGSGQLAMANAGPVTNSSQFYITTGQPRFLDFQHTIFGQLVSGTNILTDMTKVSVTANAQGENSKPVSPIIINTASLSTTNPNGVVLINAVHALAPQTATITVTATDSVDHTTTSQSFPVTIIAEPGTIERPYVNPVANLTVGQNQTATFQIPAVAPTPGDTLSYAIEGGTQTTVGTGGTPVTTFTPVQNATATVDGNGNVTVTPTPGFSGTINLLLAVRDSQNRGTGTINDPSNFNWTTTTLTVNSSSTPVLQVPLANPVGVNAVANTPQPVQLSGLNPNAGGSAVSYQMLTSPTYGKISAFNAATGAFVYTPNADFSGPDTFQYVTTATTNGQTLTSLPATITIQTSPANTHTVRLIGTVLTVTPPPRTDHGTNNINVSEAPDPANPGSFILQVTLNGVLDATQPSVSAVTEIVVQGGKLAKNNVTINSNVDLPALLIGGQRGKNVLVGGSGPTREHGWTGYNSLVAGTNANNYLAGRKGIAQLHPHSSTDTLFLGSPNPHFHHGRPSPPVGTFYRYVHGKIVPLPPVRGPRIHHFNHIP